MVPNAGKSGVDAEWFVIVVKSEKNQKKMQKGVDKKKGL